VFLCLDQGKSKALAIKKLTEYGVPFIDVGMGLIVKDSTLGGILRVTTSTPNSVARTSEFRAARRMSRMNMTRISRSRILNALNAALAVIKWKKVFVSTPTNEGEHFSTYSIDCNLLHQRRNLMARQTELTPEFIELCAL